ncbi:hypothetical protein TrRE_jg11484 [Triparma retinervis]|uniref:Uncharacterized protein n=1 Tax=Triparma retinervis TaxID=2557542 RepID=A0A9W6Z731_9STRA|nr:hypothetical protein TrRE_jg11484 [Triparma retinervis]
MLHPNKTQSQAKVCPKNSLNTVFAAASAPIVPDPSKGSLLWTSLDDERYCASLIFPRSSCVSDKDMQDHVRDNLKVACPGTPDATVFEEGTAISGDSWNIRCLQVTRGYSRKHVNCMIAEKVYKSTIWLATISAVKSDLTCNSFIISVLVRPSLHDAALRIASYANVLLKDTVFDVRIISAPQPAAAAMTTGISNARKGSLLEKRKYRSASLVLEAVGDGKEAAEEAGINFDDDEHCSYELLFIIFELDEGV